MEFKIKFDKPLDLLNINFLNFKNRSLFWIPMVKIITLDFPNIYFYAIFGPKVKETVVDQVR